MASGDNLTRENVMHQAASIHDLKLPMLLPGITIYTGADDFAPIKQMQLEKFDGTTVEAVRRGHLGLGQLAHSKGWNTQAIVNRARYRRGTLSRGWSSNTNDSSASEWANSVRNFLGSVSTTC